MRLYSLERVNPLLFFLGYIGPVAEIIADYLDKTYKNIFIPKITKGAKDLINFTISWVRSLDPVSI